MVDSSSTCEVLPQSNGASIAEAAFCNINPNLPSGIRVGYQHENESIFCLDADDRTTCYKDMTEVHRILSHFNLSDFDPEENKGANVAWGRKLLDDEADEGERTDYVLSLEDMDNLLPGMWLNCRYDDSDAEYYDAIFLTSDITRMSPEVADTTKQNYLGHIGVEYDEEQVDDDEEDQKWIPISWCKYDDKQHTIWPCNVSQDVTDSKCHYMVEDNSKNLFHRAFKDLSSGKHPQSSSDEKKVLFTYTQYESVGRDKEGYLKMRSQSVPLPPELNLSSYSTVYSHIPFTHPLSIELDNKFNLYLLYKDDPRASKVFPKSYSSYREALIDTKPGEEDDGLFYIKDSGAARGEGIYIKTWDELGEAYLALKDDGEYDVDEGEEDVIIQRAVTDLYTVDGDGPIAKRRFDIRYFVLVAQGKVYLHSYMFFRWSLGPEYDAKNTNVESQVINVVAYSGADLMARLHFADEPLKDAHGNAWNNSAKKRRRISGTSSNGNKGFDPHSWRDAVSDALDDACGVFSNLKELTKADPTKYVLAGGDAMIKEDGSAVIVEFNIWPDIAVSYAGLSKCLAGDGCRRMILMLDGDGQSDMSTDEYVMSEHSPASSIVSSEGLASVLRDTALLVMQLRPANEIGGFREILARD